MEKSRIMIVEDEGIVADDIKMNLLYKGYKVTSVVPTGEEAVEKAGEERPDLVLMDIKLQGEIDGIEAAERITSRFHLPVVYLTAYADERTLERAKRTEPYGYIVKPIEAQELFATVETSLYRHKMEAELRETKEQLATIFSTMHMLIAYLDTDFNFIRVNDAYALADEREPEFFVGRNHFDLYPNKENEEIFRRVIETGMPYTVYSKPFVYKEHPERGITYWDWTLSPEKSSGKVVGLTLVISDVTKRVRAEELLRLSEEKLAEAQHIARIGHWDYNVVRNILSWSKETYDIFGIPRKTELSFETFIDRIHPDDREEIERQAREGLPYRTDYRIVLPDGRIKFIHEEVRVERDENGGLIRMWGTAQDITKRKETEDALRAAHDRLSFHIRRTPLGYIEWNEDFEVVEWNPAAERMFGYSRNEAMGRHAADLIVPREVRPAVTGVWKNLLAQKGGTRNTNENVTKDGRWILCDWYNTPLVNKAGAVVGVASLVDDITERKKTEDALRAAHDRLSFHIRQTPLGYIEWNEDFEVVEWNPAAERMFGYSRNEAMGRHAADLIVPPEVQPAVTGVWKNLLAQKGGTRSTNENVTKDGRRILCDWYNTPLVNKAGAVIGVASLVDDITERKETEDALRAAHDRLSFHIRRTPLGYIEWNEDFEVVEWNPAAEQVFGYSRNEAMGRHADLIVPLEVRPHVAGIWGNLLAQKGGTRSTNENVTKDGRRILCEWYNTPLINKAGAVIGVASLVDDITERKKAEEMLRDSEETTRAILNATFDAAFMIDTEGTILAANTTLAERFGKSVAELIGSNNYDLLPPETAEGRKAKADEVIRTGNPVRFEDVWEGRYMDNSVYPVLDAEGNVGRLALFSSDITEKRRTERFVKDVLEAVGEAFIVVDRDYKIISANRAYCEQIGRPCEDILGHYCYEISHGYKKPCFDEGEECSVRSTFITHGPYETVHVHRGGKGGKIYVETRSFPLLDESGNVAAAIEIINDITEKRRLEGQLIQSQKMEAVGQLAGGIAHDFNNLLTAIMGYGEVMKMRLRDTDPLREYVSNILVASEKAAALTRGLLAFSRKQEVLMKPINLNSTIVNIQKLVTRIIGEDIELDISICGETIPVMADAGQLEQVIMNLCTNARDSMPEGGNLFISTGIVEVNAESARVYDLEGPGSYATMSIRDTGLGMDKETMERIFEPFFTTKELGKGTGLGLSIVYGIVKQHQGSIQIESDPGKGTTFRIYIPILNETEEALAVPASRPFPSGGTEMVLLAEDSASLRDLIANILRSSGYTVIEAVDGEDAVDKFISNKERIDILILDVIMPKMDGKTVYEEIKKIRPDIKALFTSGYTADILGKKGVLEEGLDIIAKPFSPVELLSRVRSILDKKKV